MSNEQQNDTLLPALRFPEFQDAGEWGYVNGNEIFEQISNKNHSSDLPILAITQEHGAIPREQIDYTVIVTAKSVESYKVVEQGDFIISLRSFQGGIEYSNYKGLCSPAYIILRNKVDIVNDFYRHYFKSFQYIQDLNKNIEGIRDGKMVSFKQFSEIEIPIPSLSEQQKIADCLSSLDEWITAEGEKLEALKAHKKGLMQQLFPAQGETVPRLRFPEFQDAEEWEEKTLGEVAPLQRGFDLPIDSIVVGDYPVVFSNGILKYHNEFKVKAPGVVTGRSGTIGKVTYVSKDFWPHNTSLWVTDFCGNDPLFVFYLFVFIGLEQFGTGSGVPTLNRNDVHKHTILIPSLHEQHKIADCLSSLDELIMAQGEKVGLLKRHKKGLMQGLFPQSSD